MKKLYILFISLFLLLPLNILATTYVDYDIENYLIDATLEIDGDMLVKEIIVLDGDFNGYIRDIEYKNDYYNANSFNNNFEGSSFYDGSSISLINVGSIDFEDDDEFDNFNKNINYFKLGTGYNGVKGIYERSNLYNGISLKMFNETIDDETAFYIEYIIHDVSVLHNDVAEIYYNFIGSEFADKIEKLKIKVNLPYATTDDVRVWAHGPLNGNIEINKKENNIYGAYVIVKELKPYTPVDIRMTYPKYMLNGTKISNVNAFDKIIEVETIRANEANKERERAKALVYGTYFITGLYLIGLIYLTLRTYKKYDKEYDSEFNLEYYREIIDEYEIPSVEYLMNKNISPKSFSSQILNLIYKKNISVTKTDKKKYTLKLKNTNNITETEEKIIKLIFNEIGNGEMVTTDKIQRYSKEVTGTSSPFLQSYNSWKTLATKNAKNENFYENFGNKKFKLFMYSLVGFFLFYLLLKIGNAPFAFALIIINIAFIIYILTFNKKTKRGIEHYKKWNAFKKFLDDFGRFEEKELPEIILWEKYLVYATLFGLADKVSKAMEIKVKEFSSVDASYTSSDIFWDYYFYTNLNRDLTRTINNCHANAISAVNRANSTSSSGSGFGGGFSGGGGFGGGGGGGRGF